MNSTTRRIVTVGTSVLAVAAVVGLAAWGVTGVQQTPEPTPVAVEQTRSFAEVDPTPRAEARAAAAAAAAQAEADRLVAEAAAAAQAEADRIAAEQAAQQQAEAETYVDPGYSEPAGPIKCPAGSMAYSGDGPNDTACLPSICFNIVLPDPAHPECDQPFRP